MDTKAYREVHKDIRSLLGEERPAVLAGDNIRIVKKLNTIVNKLLNGIIDAEAGNEGVSRAKAEKWNETAKEIGNLTKDLVRAS